MSLVIVTEDIQNIFFDIFYNPSQDPKVSQTFTIIDLRLITHSVLDNKKTTTK